jgi:hypothetical protein
MVSHPHRVSSGTDPKTIIILTEGDDDYNLEEGAPVLTEGGFQRMGQLTRMDLMSSLSSMRS